MTAAETVSSPEANDFEAEEAPRTLRPFQNIGKSALIVDHNMAIVDDPERDVPVTD